MSSINSASNHQPALVAVAQHGSLDDAVYFVSLHLLSSDPLLMTCPRPWELLQELLELPLEELRVPEVLKLEELLVQALALEELAELRQVPEVLLEEVMLRLEAQVRRQVSTPRAYADYSQ